jgi:hypothetical protein
VRVTKFEGSLGVHELPIFGRFFQGLYGRRSTSDDLLHLIEISVTNETLLLDGP